jgi:DNA-binding SARP family transcriptional activator
VAEASLAIRCFGTFEVFRDGLAVQHWRREPAKTLLKQLTIHRRPTPRDMLLHLLWPEVSASIAGGYLRVVLHALRQAIGTWSGRDYIRIENDRLSLDPAAPVWIDTDAFAEQVQTAEALMRQHRHAEAVQEFGRAELIYRDDYLAEDENELEHTLLVRREAFKDRYQLVLTRLADLSLEMGDFIGGISRCHKLLAQDSSREDAYQRLMYCHAALGQRSRALRWYELCQAALQDELGMAPGDCTRDLYERILAERSPAQKLYWLQPALLGGNRQP